MFLRSAGLLLLLAAPAFAQTPTVIPPAPAVVAAPPAAPAPATPPPAAGTPTQIGQTPASGFDDGSTQPAPAPDQSTLVTAPPPATTAPAIPNTWLPGNSATLGVLNTVDGTSSQVTIQVGGHAVIGDLTVSVLACANRPPTEVPDTAIFLTTAPTASGNTAPAFRGWLIRSMPGATVAGDAGEVFRVVSCAPP